MIQGSSSFARLKGNALFVGIVGLGNKAAAAKPAEWGISAFQVLLCPPFAIRVECMYVACLNSLVEVSLSFGVPVHVPESFLPNARKGSD